VRYRRAWTVGSSKPHRDNRRSGHRDAYRPGARRFDVGQRTNFGLVHMAIAAVEQLLEWTIAGVASLEA
jgi:hypothetical protein